EGEERGDGPPPKEVEPAAVNENGCGRGFGRPTEKLGVREPPARRLAVRTWNFGRRIPVGQDRRQRRLHQRTLAVWIAADEEIRRRRLVPAGPFVQESAVRPVGRWQPALRTPDRLVASAVRVEAPITVGDDLGHRQRLWPLPIERGDLRAQLLGLRELLRLHQLLYIGDGATTACEHLGRQQLLAWCPLGFGLEDRGLNVWRVLLLDVLGPHRFTRRRFDLRDAIAQRRNLVVNFLVGFGVRRCLRARRERHFDLDPSVDRGRETVVVVL